MTTRALTLAILCLMGAAVYAQSGVAGKWRTAEQPNPELVIRLDLETDGARVSGTVIHFEQEPRQISNGSAGDVKASRASVLPADAGSVGIHVGGRIRQGLVAWLSSPVQMLARCVWNRAVAEKECLGYPRASFVFGDQLENAPLGRAARSSNPGLFRSRPAQGGGPLDQAGGMAGADVVIPGTQRNAKGYRFWAAALSVPA
jgi:hypothetical protein